MVISVDYKVFVLSNNAPQSAFELLDPKSDSSQQLRTPQFYYSCTRRLAKLRNAITGFVVIKRCSLFGLTTSLNLRHSPEERSFIVYDIRLNEWNFVQTIPSVGVVGDMLISICIAICCKKLVAYLFPIHIMY